MSIATTLNRLMCERDMSARRLAEISGVSYTNLNKYLSGKIIPADEPIEKLCSALDVSRETLCGKHTARPSGKLRPQDAAEMLNLSAQTVRVMMRDGSLPIGAVVKNRTKYAYEIDPVKLKQYAEDLALIRQNLANI